MWSTGNVGHEPGVQTGHNILQEDTLPLLVQFFLARKIGKSCHFKATRFSISGAIASHSAEQCECERVCSIHNLACSITSTVKTCHLWKEKPPKKVRDMKRAPCAEPHLGQNILRHVRGHSGRVRVSFIYIFMALFVNVLSYCFSR